MCVRDNSQLMKINPHLFLETSKEIISGVY